MISPTLIRENLEVLGSDGEHVGIVDHLESNGEVRLAKDDTGGEYHYIPLGWVVHVAREPISLDSLPDWPD